jgi:hypothetical protein
MYRLNWETLRKKEKRHGGDKGLRAEDITVRCYSNFATLSSRAGNKDEHINDAPQLVAPTVRGNYETCT